jgi:hypothetical protein
MKFEGIMPTFRCPVCNKLYRGGLKRLGKTFDCINCQMSFLIPADPSELAPAYKKPKPVERIQASPNVIEREYARRPVVEPIYGDEEPTDGSEHSSLGIASFMIAFFVVGMEAVMFFISVVKSDEQDATPVILMIYGACMSAPLCLIGLGLGITGLYAQADRKQTFSTIGIIGNGAMILGLLGLYVFGALLTK